MPNNNNDIEKLFKDAFDQFEPNVDASVWSGVEQGIKNIPAAPAAAVVKSFSAIKAAVAIIATATVGFVTYTFISTKSPEAIVTPTPATAIVTQNDAPASEEIKIPLGDNASVQKTATEKTSIQNSTPQTAPQQTSVNEKSDVPNTPAAMVEGAAPSYAAPSVKQPQPEPSATHAAEPKQTTAEPKQTESLNEPADTKDNTAIKTIETCDLKLPNTFTPNGDDINDTYFIDDNNLSSVQVKILDLRGNVIKQWSNMGGMWDGKLANNTEAPNGTYLLILNAVCKNGEPFNKKIQIRLIRQ